MRLIHTSLFLAIQALVGVELLEHWQIDHRVVFESEWIAFSLAGLSVYLVIRVIKKRTTWLIEPGRMASGQLET